MVSQSQIKNLLEDSWRAVNSHFLSIEQFSAERPPQFSVQWEANSVIRRFGSEYFLQAHFFRILEEQLRAKNLANDILLTIEDKAFRGTKEIDIAGWTPDLKELLFAIELKVTGSFLLERPEPKRRKPENANRPIPLPHFQDEVLRYSAISPIRDHDAIFFFGCYYESLGSEILSKLSSHNSLMGWGGAKGIFNNIQNFDHFKRNVVEGYIFRGNTPCVLLDNGAV